jgi:hypothetical protein
VAVLEICSFVKCIRNDLLKINLGAEFKTNSSSGPHSMPSNLQTQEALHGNFFGFNENSRPKQLEGYILVLMYHSGKEFFIYQQVYRLGIQTSRLQKFPIQEGTQGCKGINPNKVRNINQNLPDYRVKRWVNYIYLFTRRLPS